MHFRILDARVVSSSVTSFLMISAQNSHVSTEDSTQKKFSCHVEWLVSLFSDWSFLYQIGFDGNVWNNVVSKSTTVT